MATKKLYVVVPDGKSGLKTSFYSEQQEQDAGDLHFAVDVSPEVFELFQTLERLYSLDGGNGFTEAMVGLYDSLFKAGIEFSHQ